MPTTPKPSHSKKDSRWTPEEYRQKPRDWTPHLEEIVLDRIANGDLLVDICADRDLPLPGTFLRWCDEDPSGLGDRYRKALAIGMDVNFDEAVSEAFGSDVFRAGLRSRALMQRAERGLPAKYGPRATVIPGKGGGSDDDQPAGIDYAAEVRRKLQAISDRLAAPAEETPTEPPAATA